MDTWTWVQLQEMVSLQFDLGYLPNKQCIQIEPITSIGTFTCVIHMQILATIRSHYEPAKRNALESRTLKTNWYKIGLAFLFWVQTGDVRGQVNGVHDLGTLFSTINLTDKNQCEIQISCNTLKRSEKTKKEHELSIPFSILTE